MIPNDLITLTRHLGYVEGILRGITPDSEEHDYLIKLLFVAQIELDHAQDIIMAEMEKITNE
jgi:hypothetical protein